MIFKETETDGGEVAVVFLKGNDVSPRQVSKWSFSAHFNKIQLARAQQFFFRTLTGENPQLSLLWVLQTDRQELRVSGKAHDYMKEKQTLRLSFRSSHHFCSRSCLRTPNTQKSTQTF